MTSKASISWAITTAKGIIFHHIGKPIGGVDIAIARLEVSAYLNVAYISGSKGL
jgi:hypothetical protein